MTVREAADNLADHRIRTLEAERALREAIVQADRDGVTRKRIAEDAGMSRTTLYKILSSSPTIGGETR